MSNNQRDAVYATVVGVKESLFHPVPCRGYLIYERGEALFVKVHVCNRAEQPFHNELVSRLVLKPGLPAQFPVNSKAYERPDCQVL